MSPGKQAPVALTLPDAGGDNPKRGVSIDYNARDILVNPKEAGSFDPISQPGGPRISAAEQPKILKFGTYVGLVNTNVLTKLQY